ncbi:hypothetical protein SAMN05216388_10588 [Halorientalis persicus]|uniref:Uncharacterized protein n=1 Tax=Halorientalis persicus TaxID=1367881 RepID=A0A1H8WG56_9EURY|nr:hypothetical protein SAMN05216388_10588 [Halorientalis persicus]
MAGKKLKSGLGKEDAISHTRFRVDVPNSEIKI